jgi:uncharacterized protein (TIGR02145 family)
MKNGAYITLVLSLFGSNIMAQALMNIHRSGQPLVQYQVSEIDSITYSVVGDPGALPLVVTLPLGAFTANTATLGGDIDGNGGTTVSARGLAWGENPNPTTADNITMDGAGTGTYESNITGLNPGVVYYARAYATNNAGTAYGNEVEFEVTNDSYLPGNGVTDIDGNFYPTIHVSTGHEWMARNLTVCRYSNGDSILHLITNVEWAGSNEGAWAAMNNNPEQTDVFGKLYNGWAVTDPRNVCPLGWHAPTESEWTAFHSANGGLSNGGGNMKSTGITIWLAPNTGASNSSGFSGLPGGRRMSGGDFQEVYGSGFWWSSTGNSALLNTRALYYTSNGVWTSTNGKFEGLSIRCVKDQ